MKNSIKKTIKKSVTLVLEPKAKKVSLPKVSELKKIIDKYKNFTNRALSNPSSKRVKLFLAIKELSRGLTLTPKEFTIKSLVKLDGEKNTYVADSLPNKVEKDLAIDNIFLRIEGLPYKSKKFYSVKLTKVGK